MLLGSTPVLPSCLFMTTNSLGSFSLGHVFIYQSTVSRDLLLLVVVAAAAVVVIVMWVCFRQGYSMQTRPGTHYEGQAGFELTAIHLSLPPEY